MWGCRNCETPGRSHCAHASSTEPGRGPLSRSRLVTSWPSRASSIAAVNPTTPPPQTTTSAIAPPLVIAQATRCDAPLDAPGGAGCPAPSAGGQRCGGWRRKLPGPGGSGEERDQLIGAELGTFLGD